MKLSREFNSILMFLAVLITIITAYYVNNICIQNSISSEYCKTISLTGSRLSDRVFATCSKVFQNRNVGSYSTEYEITVYNISKYSMTNWKISMIVPDDTLVEETWNVEYSYYPERNELVFTPEYYNQTMESEDLLDFYVDLRTPGEFMPNEISFVGYEVIGSGQNIFSRSILVMLIVWTMTFIGFLVTKFNLKSYKQRQQNDVKIILQSMNTFISFIDAKDPYTRGHSKRVAMYAAEIAKRMNLSEDEIQNIYYAGLLHDAGKISIPDAVLNKPGKLTEDERKLIQNHTIAGGKMLKQLSSIRGIRETALYHHERFDGSGYPEGLKGESIPLYARIVGVADSYDAMSSNRVYRRHLNKDDIIEEIQKGSGTQFDPDIVKFMVDMINDGYVNVVKMETADNDEESSDFHIRESDLPIAAHL